MEDPANPFRFDQTPETRFFMCRSCRNHILPSQMYTFEDIILKVIIGPNAVNVWAADVVSGQLLLTFPVVEVFCNGCCRSLGYKFVLIAEPNIVIQDGRFMFFEDRMLYWNGSQVLYADTLQPVENN